MSPSTHNAILAEHSRLTSVITCYELAHDIDDRDGRALLRMLRDVRLFLTPEQPPHDRPTSPVDNPSFG
jgi:hypothetical protein